MVGDLYFLMGEVMFHYRNVTRIVSARVALFLVLLAGVFVAIFTEVYFKCSNLNYQIKLVK